MRKITAFVVVLTIFVSLGVQAIERVYSGIAPGAEIVMYLDGTKCEEAPFAKALETFVKAHENDAWIKNLEKKPGAQKQEDEFKELLKKLGIDEDDDAVVKMVGSAAFKRGADGTLDGIKDFVLAAELNKALDMQKALAVFQNFLSGKARRHRMECSIDTYKKSPMMLIKPRGEQSEWKELGNMAILAVDGKLLFVGMETSCKAAFDRCQSGKILDMDSYFKGMTSHDFFVGTRMFKELRELFDEKGKEIPAMAKLKDADGIALTMDVRDAMHVDLRAALKTPEDAAAVKINLWDNLCQPMLMIYGNNVKQQVGGEFPLIDSFKGVADGRVFKVGFSLTMKDVEIIFGFIKEYMEMRALLEAPAPDAQVPAPKAQVPAAPVQK